MFPPSGIPAPGQAVAYIEYLGEALRYDALKEELYRERKADPDIADGGLPRNPPAPAVPRELSKIASMAGHPEVAEAFRTVRERDDIPSGTRALVDVLARLEAGGEVENLLKDGRFERGGLDGWNGGRIVSEKSFRGGNSMRVNLSPRAVFGSKHTADHPTRVEPGMYLASVMVYVDADRFDVEQSVQMTTTGQRDGMNLEHWRTPSVQIQPGEWTRLSVVADIRPNMNSFGICWIVFENYEAGDVAYIDDIVIVRLDQE